VGGLGRLGLGRPVISHLAYVYSAAPFRGVRAHAARALRADAATHAADRRAAMRDTTDPRRADR
jgi:hypothetical protein